MTDRWQKRTSVPMNQETFERLARYCDEFLIHAVDVEGKASGVEKEVVRRLGNAKVLPVTYAGGIHSMEEDRKSTRLNSSHTALSRMPSSA